MTVPYYNSTHNITIDLSPRQSGKTLRLVNEAIGHLPANPALGTDFRIIIITINNFQTHYLRRKINEELCERHLDHFRNKFVIHSIDRLKNNPNEIMHLAKQKKFLYLFDEFEMMKDLPVIQNSYYSGSATNRWGECNTNKILNVLFPYDTDEYRQVKASLQVDWSNSRDRGYQSNERRYTEIVDAFSSDDSYEPARTDENDYLYRIGAR